MLDETPPAPDWATITPQAALELAIKRAGNQLKLAEICGCTQGAISQMLNRVDPRLSHHFVIVVSTTLDIPRTALRPDLYPPEDEEAQQSKAA